MTPLPRRRRDETVGVRRAELGIRAVRTETTMAVRPKCAPSGIAHAFHLESRAQHALNLTGRGYEFRSGAHGDRGSSWQPRGELTSTHPGVPPISFGAVVEMPL
jgi:hypothetical protein